MNIDIGLYYRVNDKINGSPFWRTVNLNQGELEEIIEDYIKKEYLRPYERLVSISIEGVNEVN